jgi:signal peptidase I
MNPEIPTKENKESFFKEIIKFTILALAIVIPIRAYVAQPFIVNGSSMDPTFNTGQYIIVDRLTYHFSSPSRGDVLIFKYPKNTKEYYIKRLIGLPGETVSATDGIVTIKNKENPDGIVLDDSFVIKEHKTSDSFNITLGEDEYFVMGDNRAASSDSRVWGPLDEKYISGRALVRLLPLTKISIFPGEIKI